MGRPITRGTILHVVLSVVTLLDLGFAQERNAATERYRWQPKGLAQVFGTHRAHLWGSGYAVEYHPSGNWLVTGSQARVLRVWDSKSLRELAATKQLPGGVEDVEISSDGKYILAAINILSRAGNLAELRIWSYADGSLTQLAKFDEFDEFCERAHFTEDGKTIICDGGFSRVHVLEWNGKRLKKNRTIKLPSTSDDFDISPDGRWMVVSDYQAMRVFNLRTDKITDEFRRRFWTINFYPEGSRFIAGGDRTDAALTTWRIDEAGKLQQLSRVPEVAQGGLNTVDFSSDAQRLASNGGFGNAIRVWRTTPGLKQEKLLKGHTQKVGEVAISPSGKALTSVGWDQTIRQWTLKDGQPTPASRSAHAVVNYDARKVIALAESKALLSITNRSVRWIDSSSGRQLRKVSLEKGDPRTITDAIVSEEADAVLVSVQSFRDHRDEWPPQVLQFKLGDGSRLRAYDAQPASWKLDETQRRVAIIVPKKGLRILDLESGKTLSKSPEPGELRQVVLFNGDRLVTKRVEAQNIVLDIWKTTGGKIAISKTQRIKLQRPSSVYTVALARRPQFALQTRGGFVQIWELGESGLVKKKQFPLADRQYFVKSFSPDGKQLLFASYGHLKDRAIHLWNSSTGKVIAKFNFPSNPSAAAFLPDGRRIATANPNGTMYILEL